MWIWALNTAPNNIVSYTVPRTFYKMKQFVRKSYQNSKVLSKHGMYRVKNKISQKPFKCIKKHEELTKINIYIFY